MQFGMLRHARLDEQRAFLRVQPGTQPVDDHVPHMLFEFRGVLVTGGQGVPVRDEKIAVVLVLQVHPIAQRAMVVPEMQLARRAHTRKNAAVGKQIRSAQAGILWTAVFT